MGQFSVKIYGATGSALSEKQHARAFANVPCVTLGLTGIDASHDQNLRFWLKALDVKKEGFTIEFSTWSDTHIARASVSWQAIGQAKPDIVKAASKATT